MIGDYQTLHTHTGRSPGPALWDAGGFQRVSLVAVSIKTREFLLLNDLNDEFVPAESAAVSCLQEELVELVLGQRLSPSSSSGPETTGTDPPSVTSRSPTWDPEEAPVPGRRASLADLTCLDDIEALSVRQLKEILARNFVDYKGCCEKWELMERVRRLYQDQQNLLGERSGGVGTGGLEENLCKICMDSPIDCVLLECGHMVTCTKCGKRMSECPMCRQYVVRAVHVFRS
uniref:Ring finger and FYVE-like domain containing E3 ubiquitin protein ligase n=1 Tax=Oreochromis niloticus TaxID=8128 RepID=A0A669EY13_ORENI